MYGRSLQSIRYNNVSITKFFMRTIKWCSYWVLVAFLIPGCDKAEENPSAPAKQDLAIQEYLNSNEIDFIQEDEFYYYKIQPNDDGRDQISGKILSIYYTLRTLDGVVVDQHQFPAEPVRLLQGAGTVYPTGLNEGLKFMREGEVFGFLFPSHLAYGNIGVNDILPPNSIVAFEVELVKIENPGEVFASEYAAITDYLVENGLSDPDTIINFKSGLRMIMTEIDNLATQVLSGDDVGINWIGYYLNGGSFGGYTGNDIFEFETGKEIVVDGLEEGVMNMRLGESAILAMPSELAYGPSVTVIPQSLTELLIKREIIPTYARQIPPFTPLIFEVEVRTIQ